MSHHRRRLEGGVWTFCLHPCKWRHNIYIYSRNWLLIFFAQTTVKNILFLSYFSCRSHLHLPLLLPHIPRPVTAATWFGIFISFRLVILKMCLTFSTLTESLTDGLTHVLTNWHVTLKMLRHRPPIVCHASTATSNLAALTNLMPMVLFFRQPLCPILGPLFWTQTWPLLRLSLKK